MTQYGRPISDIATGSWATASLYARIDEASPNDADYITSGFASSTCKLGITSLSDPASASDHKISYRHVKGTIGSSITTMYLYCGATLIASQAEADSGSFVTHTYTLSAAEANAITDYTALQIWFTGAATNRTIISWCEFQCPDLAASTVTIPNTPGVTVAAVTPAVTGTALVTIPTTPNVTIASITPTGIGVTTVVTIPNTPNVSVGSVTPSSVGVTISLFDDIPLVGTFVVDTALVGTFVSNVALDGTFIVNIALDGSIS